MTTDNLRHTPPPPSTTQMQSVSQKRRYIIWSNPLLHGLGKIYAD